MAPSDPPSKSPLGDIPETSTLETLEEGGGVKWVPTEVAIEGESVSFNEAVLRWWTQFWRSE